ncbi:hypothetical protein ABZP36_024294 [Zizania latifolia]
MEEPHEDHRAAVKHILRYIAGTRSHGVHYAKKVDSRPSLLGYSDNDMAGDLDTRRSTSGVLFFFGSSPITWQSAKQKVVALSSCEAEYIAVAAAVCQAIWLARLLGDLFDVEPRALGIKVDNKSTIAMSKNPVFHDRSKKAKPVEKLEATYRAFLERSSKKKAHSEDDTPIDDHPVRNFGTVLNRGEIVYKDENSLPSQGLARTRSNNTAWQTLGTQAIPQKVGSRAAVQPTRVSSIEVFVDDGCDGEPAPLVPKNSPNPSILKLRQATGRSLKQETELLMHNPLRNFPLSSLR